MEKQEKTGYAPLVLCRTVFYSGVKFLHPDSSMVQYVPFPGRNENPQHHNNLEISQEGQSQI